MFLLTKKRLIILFVLFMGASVLYALLERINLSNPENEKVRECKAKRVEQIANYERLMSIGEPWKATNTIRVCANILGDPEMLEMVKKGELDDRMKTARDENASSLDRFIAIEQIEDMDPAKGAELKPLKAQISKLIEAQQAKTAKETVEKKRKSGVSLGMSKEDVLASSWGHPKSINRSVYSFGVREQWVYGGGNYLYFKDGVLDSIQTSN
jgi:hypothetical protein